MNRIKLVFALGASVAVLASQACNKSAPPAGQSTSATGEALVPGLSLRIDLYPKALAGQPFGVDVSFRNSSGLLMDVSDLVTLSFSTNPTGATLQGTTTQIAVNGVARFPDLVISNVGRGYALSASSLQAGLATSSLFAVAFSDDATTSSPTTPATAREISPKVPEYEVIAPGQVHYFKFHAKFGQVLSVTSYANRIDMGDWDTSLRLRLLAPDGTTEIARSGASNPDARGVDNGFSMLRIPQEGDYYLACDVDQAGFLSGVYALVIRLLPKRELLLQTESEPWGVNGQNDTLATAQTLSPGLLYGHYDTPATNTTTSDFYKIALLNPSRVRIDLTAARNGAAYGDRIWDAKLELQDATGAVLWSNDNSYGLDPAIDYIVTRPGTYYVRVTRSESPSNTASSPYFLSYAPSPYLPVAELAGNTTAAAATPIGYGVDVSGSFAAAGDHYFAFGGTAGDVVRLVVEDQSQLQGASLTMNPTAAADAVLLRADGVTALATGAGFSSATESKFNLRQTILQTTGTYLVRVRSAALGRFGLRLERVAASARETEPNDTVAQANLIGPSGWISGAIGAAGDQDHFKVHAEAGQLMTVSLLAAPGGGAGNALADFGSGLMPTLEVRNLQGDWLSRTSADRKGEFNFAESAQQPLINGAPMIQTTFRAPVSADYDIVVSDADGQGGPTYFYALHAWKNENENEHDE